MSNDLELSVGVVDDTQAGFGTVEGRIDVLSGAVVGTATTFSALEVAGVAALSVVAAAATATAVAVGGVIVSGTQAAIGLEQQMADVAAIMNITKEAAEPLKAIVMDLAIDPRLRVTATQAADAVQMLARNGVSMKAILEGAALGVVALSNATGGPFAMSADLATDIMAVFNIQAKDMMNVIDGVVSVTTNSKFAIQDYVYAFASAGGIARSVGVDLQDFNVAIAGISPLFNSGKTAGTSFKVMLQRLIPTTKEAASTMMELGLMSADGSNNFYDANGNLKSMADIAGLLQNSLKGLTEEQRSLALATMFGSDASRAAIGLMELGEDGFNKLMETMSKTDALKAAATRMDTVAGAVDILKSLYEGFSIQIGDAFLPVVRAMVELLIDLADIVGPRMVAFFQNAGDGLARLVDRAMAAGGPVEQLVDGIKRFAESGLPNAISWLANGFGMLANILGSVLGPLVSLIANFVSWQDVLTAVAIGLGVLIYSGLSVIVPVIAAAVTAVAPLVAGFLALVAAASLLRNAWEADFLGIRTLITNVFDVISGIIQAFVSGTPTEYPWQQMFPSWLASVALEISTVVEGVAAVVAAFRAGTLDADFNWQNVFPAWLATTIETVIDAVTRFQPVWAATAAAISDLGGLAVETVSSLAEAFGNLTQTGDLSQFWQNITSALADFAGNAGEILQGWSDAFLDWAGAGSWLELAGIIISGIINGLSDFAAEIPHVLQGWSDAFLDWAGASDWGDLVQQVLESLRTGWDDFTSDIADILSGWSDAFLDWAGASDWGDLVQQVLESLRTGWDDFTSDIADILSGWSDAFLDWAGASDWGDLAQQVIEAIGDGLVDFADGVADILSGWSDAFLDWAGASDWGDIGAMITGLINDGIVGAFDLLGSALEELAGWIASGIEDNGGLFEAAGNFVVDAIAVGLMGVAALGSVGLDLAQAILDGLATLESWIVENAPIWAQAILDFLTTHDWLGMAVDLAQAILDGLSSFEQGLGTSLGEWFNAFLEWATGSDWNGLMQRVITAVITAVKNGGNQITSQGLSQWYTTFIAWVNSVDWYKVGYTITDAVIKAIGLFVVVIPRELNKWRDAIRNWFATLPQQIAAMVKVLLVTPIFTTSSKEFLTGFPKVATGWWANIKTAFAQAKAAFIARGREIVDGIIEGIKSGASAVWEAIKGLAGGASAAMAAANEAQSPSRLYMRHAKNVIDGYVIGMNRGEAVVSQAGRSLAQAANNGFGSAHMQLDPFAGVDTNAPFLHNFGQNLGRFIGEIQAVVTNYKKEYLENIKLFLDVAQQAANLIPTLLAALNTMSQFSQVENIAPHVQAFASHMFTIVDSLYQSNTLSAKALEQTQLYTETASKIADLVTPGIAAIQALKRWEPVTANEIVPSITAFANQTAILVQALATAANSLSGEGVAHTAAYAEAIGKIAGIVEPAIGALSALAAWQAQNIMQIAVQTDMFAQQTAIMVQALATAAALFSTHALEHVTTYAETVGKVVAIVQPAIEALRDLSAWRAAEISQITAQAAEFAAQTGVLVQQMANVADAFSAELLIHTQTFADTVGKIASIIEPAIAALQQMAAYTAVGVYQVATNTLAFRNDLFVFMDRMVELAGAFDPVALDATKKLADAILSIASMIEPAIASLQSMSEYVAVGVVQIGNNTLAFRNDLFVFMSRMGELANEFSSVGLEHTQLFAKTVSAVADIIEPAILALQTLVEYQVATGSEIALRIAEFGTAVTLMLNTMEDYSGQFSSEALNHTQLFVATIKQVTEIIEPGLAALAALAGSQLATIGEIHRQMAEFGTAIALVVMTIESYSGQFETEALAHTRDFAETIKQVIALVVPALDALDRLADWQRSKMVGITTKIAELGTLMTVLVMAIEDYSGQFTTAELAHTRDLAKTIGDVSKMIGDAIDAIGILLVFAAPKTIDLANSARALASAAAEIVNQFAQVASSFEVGALDSATAFAKAAKDVFDLVKLAIEVLGLLSGYVQVSGLEQSVGLFAADLEMVGATLVDALTTSNVLTDSSLGQAAEMAKSVKAVLDMAKSAITVLASIGGYTGVENLAAATSLFAADLILATEQIADALADSSLMTDSGLQAASNLAKDIKNLLAVVKTGLEAVGMLSNYIQQSGLTESALAFGRDLVLLFGGLLDAFAESGLVAGAATGSAADLAKDIKNLLGVAKTGLDAVGSLAGYTNVAGLNTAAFAFGQDLIQIFSGITAAFAEAGLMANEASSNAADLAKDIKNTIGVVKGGIDAIAQIGTFTGVDNVGQQTSLFATQLLEVYASILSAIAEAGISSSAITSAAADLAKEIKNIVGIIKPGIDAIDELARYIPAYGIDAAARDFGADIILVTSVLLESLRASGLATAVGLSAAADLAKEIKNIIGIIKPGIDAIGELSGYTRSSGAAQAAQNFGADIIEVATILLDALVNSGLVVNRSVANAGDLAKELKDIIGLVKPGIDALTELAAYTGSSVAGAAQKFADNIMLLANTLLSAMQGGQTGSSSAVSQAAALAKNIESLLKTVKPGVDALNDLAGYTSSSGTVDNVQQFATDMTDVATMLVTLLSDAETSIGTDALRAAESFAESTYSIADSLRKSLDALQGMSQSNTPNTSRVMAYLVQQANTISSSLSDASGNVNSSLVQQAAIFAQNLNATTSGLLSALQALQGMADLNTPGSLTNLLQDIFNIFNQNAGNATAAGAAIGQGLASGAQSGLSGGQPALTSTLLDVIGALLATGEGRAMDANGIGAAFADFLGAGVLGGSSGLNGDFGTLVGAALTALGNRNTDFRNQGGGYSTQLGQGVSNGQADVLAIFGVLIVASLAALANYLAQFKSYGTSVTDEMKRGVDVGRGGFISAVDVVAVAGVDAVAATKPDYKTGGQQLVDEIKSGASSRKTSYTDQIVTVVTDGASSATGSSVATQYRNVGVALVTEIKNGAASQSSAYSAQVVGIVTAGASASATTTTYNAYRSAGSYLVQGLIDGANLQSGAFSTALSRIVSDGLVAAETAAQIASPSKKAIKISEQIVQGLIIPLERGVGTISGLLSGALSAGFAGAGVSGAALGALPSPANSGAGDINLKYDVTIDLSVNGEPGANTKEELRTWLRGEFRSQMADLARDAESRIRARR